MMQLWLMAVAGAFGAVARFGLSQWVYSVMGRDFPYGTLSVNVLGSFLFGFLFVMMSEKWHWIAQHYQVAVLIGFLGAFTTFSTFSMDTLQLIQREAWGLALWNVLFSVALSVLAVFLGMILARMSV